MSRQHKFFWDLWRTWLVWMTYYDMSVNALYTTERMSVSGIHYWKPIHRPTRCRRVYWSVSHIRTRLTVKGIACSILVSGKDKFISIDLLSRLEDSPCCARKIQNLCNSSNFCFFTLSPRSRMRISKALSDAYHYHLYPPLQDRLKQSRLQ